MDIKTISDEIWDTFCVKPLIFIGFHEKKAKNIVIAISDESVCECCLIENTSASRQKTLKRIQEKYCSAPLAVLNQKTNRFLADILDEQLGHHTSLKLMLKGSIPQLQRWQTELSNFRNIYENVEISTDNPIQIGRL